jgi:hypothetical protein
MSGPASSLPTWGAAISDPAAAHAAYRFYGAAVGVAIFAAGLLAAVLAPVFTSPARS